MSAGKIMQILSEAHEDRLFTSATLGVQFENRDPWFFEVSGEGVVYQPKLARPKIYDIASVNKFLLTILFFRLMTDRKRLAKEMFDSGKKGCVRMADAIAEFHPDLPVSKFMPIHGPFSKSLLVRHLLNFHAEFRPFMTPGKIVRRNLKVLIDQLRVVGFVENPGSKWRYANAHSILLGALLEHVYGEPLEVLFQKHLIKPLGLSDTTTNPNGMLDRTILSSHKVQLGKVHDPVARIALQEGRLIGSSGFFSSAVDLLKVVNIIVQNGNVDLADNRLKVEDSFILPFWIDRMHQAENERRSFGTGMTFWSGLRKNLEQYNPTEVEGLFKSGFTGPAVGVFKDQGVGFALAMNFLAIERRKKKLDLAKKKRSILYVRLGEEVLQLASAL